MSTYHVGSISGGKDSAAVLLLMMERCPREFIRPIFCDTGNEHPAVYEYLDYLEQFTGLTITRLKADFSEQIKAKRMFIARDQRVGRTYKRVAKFDRNGNPEYIRNKSGQVRMFPVFSEVGDEVSGEVIRLEPRQKMGWDSGKKMRWTNKAKRRALSVLHPTGNPFLDLCLWKGRFPSRKAQFCTEELKRNMAVAFQLDLIDAGHQVISWQGVRRDESLNRRNAKKMERIGPRMWAFRPLVDWSALQVFDYCGSRGLKPNPLYLQGMNRVGCMPCINVSKGELREIAIRFPDEIQRIAEWERLVSFASKRAYTTFMHKGPVEKYIGTPQETFEDGNIQQVVQWSKTTRGGRQFDLLADLGEPTACASAYGLCE